MNSVDKAHGIDSTGFGTFSPMFQIQKGFNAMQVQATVFSRVMQYVPWGVLDRAVEEHGAGRFVREFSMRSHLAALFVAQLSGARSLREVEATMAAGATAFSRLGIEPAVRSTLADANA